MPSSKQEKTNASGLQPGVFGNFLVVRAFDVCEPKQLTLAGFEPVKGLPDA